MKRIGYVDAARGLLVLYVVLVIHGLFWLGLLPKAVSSLLLFAMPAMFVVAGYSYGLYERSRSDQGRDILNPRQYFTYLFVRYTRMLVPYFIYALSCVVLMSILPLFNESPWYALRDLTLAWINPFQFGSSFTAATLNWHLWFIPVYLLVTAALPVATRFRPLKNPNPFLLLIAVTLAAFLSTTVHFASENLIKETLFYLLFALFGYYLCLARSREYFLRIHFGVVALLSAGMLAIMAFSSSNPDVMNMQVNKFPPNHLFFLFSCCWISLFLLIATRWPGWQAVLEKLSHQFWLKPFIKYGFSIYLWQGVGYTVALLIGKWAGLPVLVIWPLALGITVGLGIIAGPAEKIRWRFPRVKRAESVLPE